MQASNLPTMALANIAPLEFELVVQTCKNLRKFNLRFPKKFNKYHEWFITEKLGKLEDISLK